MSEIQLKNEIEFLLKIVASKENIVNYEPIFNVKEALRGDGFLGEFFLAGIKNKNTNEVIELAIKKAVKDEAKRKEFIINEAYVNEVFFYSTIFPTLKKLQIEKSLKEPFVEIAKFYYGTNEEFQEALVMENLKLQGYVIRNKEELLDDEHTRLILKTYGKFHALSFALKDQKFEKYQNLVNGIEKQIMEKILRNNSFKQLLKGITQDAYEALDTKEDADIRKRFQKFRDYPDEEFCKAVNSQSDYKVIIHGDCWSNNMMFRYHDSGKIESMKLIDFQIINESSPVYDLSYFFYVGATKEQFDKFDHYLKIYHDSLSKNLRELGSNPEKLYPLEQLRKDWAKHSAYGLMFSLLVTKVKLIDHNEIQDMVKDDAREDVFDGMLNAKVNKDVYNERIRNILLHAAKYNVI